MSRGSETNASRRWLSFAVCLFLAVAVWAVFGQTRHHDFVNFDDDEYVTENRVVAQGLSWNGFVWAFTHWHAGNWHPLTTLSHMLDCQLFGLDPAGHHLTSVLLHAATAILLFLVLRSMTGALWPAAFVAAVFAIHPLRVESVAWVAERKDVLSGLFFMLTLWAYLRFVQQQKKRSSSLLLAPYSLLLARSSFLLSLSYWLALLFFTLGLLSKPMLVTLPFVLLLLDYWPLNRMANVGYPKAAGYRLVLEKIPFLLLAAASCGVTLWAQTDAIHTIQTLTFPWRIANALVAYATYLGQMLYPVGLAAFYPHPGTQLPVWTIGVAVLVLLIISAGVLAGSRRHPCLLLGWLWYLGMLVPVIGLLQVGDQARADRYTYLPQIGLYIMVAWAAAEFCATWRHRRALLATAAAMIIAAFMAGAYVQTTHWKNSVSLWTHTLACTSGNVMAHNGLGFELEKQGRLPEAIHQFEQALQLNPDYVKARNNLGTALLRQGKLSEAIQHLERTLQLNPDYALAHYNLGLALATQRRLAEAIPHYERALQLNPDYPEAHNNLGLALATQGRVVEAIAHYQRALQLNPDSVAVHYNLGSALANQGRLAEAVQHCQRALQLNPDSVDARVNLGIVLAAQGKLADAVFHYERALQLNPDSADAHGNLGAALSIQGRLAEALPHYERALQLNPDLAEVRYNLGSALARQGKLMAAMAHYERALQLNPDYAEVHNNLGLVLAAQGKLAEAMPHYERALQLNPDYAEAHYNFGSSLTAQGKLNEALPHFQKALQLAIARNKPALAASISNKLQTLSPP